MDARDFLKSKSFLTLVAFCGLSGLATQIDSPWWEGKLLSVAVSTPPGFESIQPLITIPEIEREVEVVDLSSLRQAVPPIEEIALPTADPETGPTEEPAVPEPPKFTPDARDVALLDMMRRSAQSASQGPSLLVIPCRDLPMEQLVSEKAITNVEGDEAPDAVQANETPTSAQGVHRGLLASAPKAGQQADCKRYALDNFYDSLRRRALGEDGLTRWSVFGDSLVVGDILTGELRRLLQKQFGDGGHGFLYVGEPLRQFGYEDIRVSVSNLWDTRSIVRHSVNGGDLFGFAGVEFKARDESSFSVQRDPTEASSRPLEHFKFLYFAPSGVTDGTLRISIDGEARTHRFSTKPSNSGMETITVPEGTNRVSFFGFSPHLRWFGVVSETSGPGIVVDNVGQVSAREEHLLKINPAHWRSQIELRDPDLISFFYGVNGASSNSSRIGGEFGNYAETYREIIRRAMTDNDNRDCLVLSLLTRGTREGGTIQATSAVAAMNRAQRAAAISMQCAFFDTTGVMGTSDDAIKRWTERQLLGADLAHPTSAGYRTIARRLHGDVLQGFVQYLERRVAGHYEVSEETVNEP